MTLSELQSRVIFQCNADEDDLSDYEPHLTAYINDGYSRLLYALVNYNLPDTLFPYLSEETDTPKLPEWTHNAIADYATWLVYRNGNTQKQSRGQVYLSRFLEVESKCKNMHGQMSVDATTGEITQTSTTPPQFTHVYYP